MAGILDDAYNLQAHSVQGLGELGAMAVQRRSDNKQAEAQAQAQRGQLIGMIAGAVVSGLGAAAGSMGGADAAGADQSKAGLPTSVGGAGKAAVLPQNTVANAPVSQGALPQSPASPAVMQTRGVGPFPQGAISNARMPTGALPYSPNPPMVPGGEPSSANWWDNLPSW
jgi:hypothetical protein